MTIIELSHVVGRELSVVYNPHTDYWTARFKGVELKLGIFLRGAYSVGDTPEEALDAYVDEIRGHRLVFDATGGKRQEFLVPKTLG